MKNLNQWLDAYAVSHQNKTNQIIHSICVPAIFLSICIALYTLRWNGIPALFFVLVLVLPFYLRMGLTSTILILVQVLAAIEIQNFFSDTSNKFIFAGSVFTLAWIGQFIGHKIEGKKPSFFEDLQFLLIGPLWVFMKKRN